MKFIITVLLLAITLFADRGYVVKTDVCGDSDNIIIETSDGWYVALELYSYAYLDEGDAVYGTLKSYGFTDIVTNNGDEIQVYIEDWESNIISAYEELCD